MEKIHALRKGLAAIAFLAEQGSCTVRELAQFLAIPEPSAGRILETLRETGFAFRARPRQPYWVTSRVLEIADSVPLLPLVIEAAGPHLEHIATTLSASVMVCGVTGLTSRLEVLRCNQRPVKKAITRFVTGYTFPVDGTASGLAITAFASALKAPAPRIAAGTPGFWSGADLKRVRRTGFAVTDNRHETRECCLAVPILVRDLPVAAIEVRAMKAVVPQDKLSARFLPVVRRCVDDIEARVGAAVRSCKGAK